MLEYHELSKSLPKMNSEEFRKLIQDIERSGLKDPILLYNGKILDGRYRYQACQELGIECQTKDFSGDAEQAFSYLLSANFYRRQLSSSQKAVVALAAANHVNLNDHAKQIEQLKDKAKTKKDREIWDEEVLAKLPNELPKDDKNQDQSPIEEDGTIPVRTSQEMIEVRKKRIAGDMLGVNGRSMDNATFLAVAAPDSLVDVLDGHISLTAKVKEIKAQDEPEEKESIKELKKMESTLKRLHKKASDFEELQLSLKSVMEQVERLLKEEQEPELPEQEPAANSATF